MRLIAYILTLGLLTLAGLAGHQLWQGLWQGNWQGNWAADPQTPPLQITAKGSPTAVLSPQAVPRHWPALFGEKQPPRPAAAPVQDEPQPPNPALPPLESLGYVLKGRVQAGQATWAIVSHPSGEQLVRQGDHLREDIEVMRIDAEGLWVSRQGAPPERLGFEE
ncbi:hypothetical protein [Pseudophaeobacter sp.]|uniref:hypothetical protein n=1 Tax=Pseudophaeobacter sp. TaxID=1971739 RepID=UPI0032988635